MLLSDYINTETPVDTTDICAENCILSAVLAEPECFPEIAVEIKPEYFSDPMNRKIFNACIFLLSNDTGIDIVTIGNQLEALGEINPEIKKHLLLLLGIVISSSHIKYHVQIIKDKWKLRETTMLAKRLINKIHGGCDYNSIQTEIFDFTGKIEKNENAKINNINELIISDIKEYKKSIETGIPVYRGIKSGFNAIDKYVQFMKHNLYVIAGRPGLGKTSLIIKIIDNVVRRNVRVLFFSAEMPEEEITEKIVSMKSLTETQELREMPMDKKIIKYQEALKFYEQHKDMFLIDDNVTSIEYIVSQTLRYYYKYPDIGMIVVDYLQLLTCDRGATRNDEISEIMRLSKQISKKLGVPFIWLSQLNRKVEERTHKRPLLSDLRESGAIEQDATAVMFLYRESHYNPSVFDKHRTELIIAKNRFGPIGTRELYFNEKYTLFTDYEKGSLMSQYNVQKVDE